MNRIRTAWILAAWLLVLVLGSYGVILACI